jgi:hypothetical protein
MKPFGISIVIFLSAFSFVNEWIWFEDQTCRISFPSAPKSDSTIVETVLGPLKMYVNILEPGDNSVDSNLIYGLAVTAYPKENTENVDSSTLRRFFDGAVTGSVNKVNGRLISQKDIRFQGVPGREVSVDYGNGMAIITMRLYLKKSQFIAVQTIALTGKEENAFAKKFFNSMEIK